MRDNKIDNIRNFCIIAHIDHGKSTLADQIIKYCGAVDDRKFRDQLLDDMELERERGITIKSSAVRLNYTAQDGKSYILNLIDTPGHVDFSYEVSKALASCEGALLLVDASQGVEAQTVANLQLARKHNLKIIPVLNKIDLPSADLDLVLPQVEALGFRSEEIILASAKESIGIEEILERIVKEVPAPKGDINNPLKALIFDSQYDQYKGVIVYFRVFDGKISVGDKIKFMATAEIFEVEGIGVLTPDKVMVDALGVGEVGFLYANIRNPKAVNIGDTITNAKNPAVKMLPGYRKIPPMVFAGVYPANASDFPALRDAMEKLALNDAAFVFEPESSTACGFGFRCGFLGLLHMEIVQERLEREFGLNLILTTPSVVYKVITTDGKELEVRSPAQMPPPQKICESYEPYIQANIIIPVSYIEPVMNLCKEKRGKHINTAYLGNDRLELIFKMPLADVITDFYDKLKTVSRGYASFDYELCGYEKVDLVKMEILLNKKPTDALSFLVPRERAYERGKAVVRKLKGLIPRQLFEISIQAAIGSKIIASEKIRPLAKNVTAKCYGGDITRKRKLWEKQKAGKKRMKMLGKVQVPQEAFLATLKME